MQEATKDVGNDDESSSPTSVFRSCRRRYMLNSLGVRLFREPDAGNLPVRFDERQQETEPSHTGLRRRRVSLVSSHPRLQPLVLDATPPARGIKGSLVGSLSVWIPNNLISGEGF